jgi:hypothetical protein
VKLALLIVQQHEILIVIDANDTIDLPNNYVTKIMTTHNLIDCLTFSNPYRTDPIPPTFIRVQNRIDYALGARNVSRSIQTSGYDAFNAVLPSDHRGIMIILPLHEILHFRPIPHASLL